MAAVCSALRGGIAVARRVVLARLLGVPPGRSFSSGRRLATGYIHGEGYLFRDWPVPLLALA